MESRIKMHNLALLEESFKKFYKNITGSPAESVMHVNLPLLQQMGLLHYHIKNELQDPSLTRYFQVFETTEKITLINDEFVIWIVPGKTIGTSQTYTLIALNRPEGPQLELTYINSGVYNTSRLVLRLLERFLRDIQENEDYLGKIKKEPEPEE
jgi:hypothetical protein